MIKHIFWLASIGLILASSCAHIGGKGKTIPAGRLVKKDDVSQKIEEAKSLHEMGEVDAAIANLRLLVDNAPYNPSHDQAYELIIEWLLQLKRHEEAKRLASYFLSNHAQSKSVQKIIDLFDKEPVPSAPSPGPSGAADDDDVLEEAADDGNQQLLDLEKSVSQSDDANQRNHLKKLADFLLYDAPLAVAEKVTNTRKAGILWGLAQTRLAIHYFHLGNFAMSKQSIDLGYPEAPQPQQALLLTLKKEIDDIGQVDAKALGILLPLSGPYASFGHKTLKAMSIAMQMPLLADGEELSSFSKDGIRIVVADSKGDPTRAKQMVEQLIKKQHVAIVIGEITNEPSLLAAQICEQYGVPMLSLSRHPQVFALGNMIFAFNSSPSQQMMSLVKYAINTKGHKRFGVLYPRHNYGMSMSKLFFDTVLSHGGEVTAIEAYDAHETTFATSVKKLVGKYHLNARPEYSACLKQQTAQQCKDVIKPIIDFDALFIPEFNKLAYVIPALWQEDMLITNSPRTVKAYIAATKIDNPQYVQLLGPNSWNDMNIMNKIAGQIDGAYFVDSVSFDESEELRNFSKSFKEMAASTPTSLDVFAHDAALLGLTILKESKVTDQGSIRTSIRDQIANFSGRVGLLTNVAFTKNGELDAKEFGFAIKNGVAETEINSQTKS